MKKTADVGDNGDCDCDEDDGEDVGLNILLLVLLLVGLELLPVLLITVDVVVPTNASICVIV